MNEQQYRRAQIDGGAARRAGRPISACPSYGYGTEGETLRDAWKASWHDEDARIKRVVQDVA